ncbi:MAG: hypothetical protein ACOYI6_07885 [Christensenellales bacterium]|jgi:polyhydroxyalkanoate synthesis regulator phasin|nr:hypothetical protein [Clostridiales bacterium]
MDHIEEKLKNIVLAGIGVIANTVEKSKDAIVDFVSSDSGKSLAQKGEQVVQSAVDAGSKAYQKVKDALSEAELRDRMKAEKERLKSLAKQVHALSDDEKEVFESYLNKYQTEPEPTSFGPEEGKDPKSEEALGKPGVTESAFDPPEGSQPSKKSSQQPLTPTAPDDEENVKRMQTNTMNEHLKQNVPYDF